MHPARVLRPGPRPADALGICERLRSAGKRAWDRGGLRTRHAARKTISDWDVATDAQPKELMSLSRAIPTGLQHGTVTVCCTATHEVTTLRGETTYSDRRRPTPFTSSTTSSRTSRVATSPSMRSQWIPQTVRSSIVEDGGPRREDSARGRKAIERSPRTGYVSSVPLGSARPSSSTSSLPTFAAIAPTLDTFRK